MDKAAVCDTTQVFQLHHDVQARTKKQASMQRPSSQRNERNARKEHKREGNRPCAAFRARSVLTAGLAILVRT